MEPYIIVKGRELSQLQKHVCEAIKNGYIPTGGPFRLPSESRMDTWYGQAMVLKGL